MGLDICVRRLVDKPKNEESKHNYFRLVDDEGNYDNQGFPEWTKKFEHNKPLKWNPFLSECRSVLSWSPARAPAWPRWHHTGAVISFLCLQSQTAQTAQAATWPQTSSPCPSCFPRGTQAASHRPEPGEPW